MKNKYSKIQKILLILIIVFSCLFILGALISALLPDNIKIKSLVVSLIFFAIAVLLTTYANKIQIKSLNEIYTDFDLASFQIEKFELPDHSNVKINNYQPYDEIPNQIFIERQLKEVDSCFDKVEFKQRAISRFIILEKCLNSKDLDELESFEDKSLYNYQLNHINELKFVKDFSVLHSNLQKYEIKNDYQYLTFNISIKCNDLNNNVNEITTFSLLFYRGKDEKTEIDDNITAEKCPNCGGSIAADTLICSYCRKAVPDDFGWKLLKVDNYVEANEEEV